MNSLNNKIPPTHTYTILMRHLAARNRTILASKHLANIKWRFYWVAWKTKTIDMDMNNCLLRTNKWWWNNFFFRFFLEFFLMLNFKVTEKDMREIRRENKVNIALPKKKKKIYRTHSQIWLMTAKAKEGKQKKVTSTLLQNKIKFFLCCANNYLFYQWKRKTYKKSNKLNSKDNKIISKRQGRI